MTPSNNSRLKNTNSFSKHKIIYFFIFADYFVTRMHKTLNTLERLSIKEMGEFLFEGRKVQISDEQKKKVKEAYEFLSEFSKDKVIYGINTGFGPMAQYKISDDNLNQLQYNLIRSHSNGTGDSLSELQIRALMISRLNTLCLGNSGVSPMVVETIETYLNNDIYPEVFQHGGVGASGDLVQLAHLGLGLIGEGYAYHKGKRYKTEELLKEKNITPLKLSLRDGLALINGTSCMSGIGVVNLLDAKRLMSWSVAASSMLNELIASYDDSFSIQLNGAKQHTGQRLVAEMMRTHLADSALIKKREDHLFNDSEEKKQSVFKEKVQEYYSLRCVPQIAGPVLDTLYQTAQVLEDEINSTNDNPVIDLETQNVYHGGNFHGDYVAFEMDKLKIAVCKLTMLMERQLNYLFNAKLNEKYPPFLNKGTLGLNFGLQGMQFTATSTTAESQTLSNPMYVHSISCNNDNQDIVSMGTNAALIAEKVNDNGFQVLGIHMIALCQAIDLMENADKLSSKTKEIYKKIRTIIPTTIEDVPLFEEMKKVSKYLKENAI